ncbi:MAG: hypothetical protein LBQ54_10230 [Planctomycetaceae bacterium]|nr:hypothetical protein [Planctomycetaceae bacterium]
MRLPPRSNNPLALLAGIRKQKNVSIRSRMERSDHEAIAVQRATLPLALLTGVN